MEAPPADEAAFQARVTAATAHGRVDEDGTVYVVLPDGSSHRVGQWAAGDAQAGLEFFARKYADLAAELDLAGIRLADGHGTPEQAELVVRKVRAELENPGCVGDMAALVSNAGQLETLAQARRVADAERREQVRAESLARREELATEAESMAESNAWRADHERFAAIVEEWKHIPRFDRPTEDALWKRISSARHTFDRRRKAHFAELSTERSSAKATKQAIISEAEALASTTDWAAGAQGFRDLMERWKSAGHAGKGKDDALWKRFRAAQDAFYTARKKVFDARDSEQRENLEAKKALLSEAEALIPVTDASAAERTLQNIRERWSRIGHVPRADKEKIDRRLRAVEQKVRAAQSEHWRRTDPAIKARAEQLVGMYEASVAKLTAQLNSAEDGPQSDPTKAAQLREQLDAQTELLEAARAGLKSLA